MMTKDNQLTWREVDRQKGKEVTADDEVFAIQALRASCFSSIAEVISHIKYRMGPYIPVYSHFQYYTTDFSRLKLIHRNC